MENELIAALKTTMVFLNSLNIETDMCFDKMVINWFQNTHNTFKIFLEGKKVGEVCYQILGLPKIHFYLKSRYINMDGEITIKNPRVLNFNISTYYLVKGTSYFDGTFKINSRVVSKDDEEYYASIKGSIRKKEDDSSRYQKTYFAINEDSLFTCQRESALEDEKLSIFPKEEPSMAYIYETKETTHKLMLKNSVKILNDAIAGINTYKYLANTTWIFDKTKKIDNFYQPIINSKDPHLVLKDMAYLMAKTSPEYQKLILNLNNSLKNSLPFANFLAHVASLAYPEYSDEEIKLLLGIEKECITFNNSDNLDNIFALKGNARKRNNS